MQEDHCVACLQKLLTAILPFSLATSQLSLANGSMSQVGFHYTLPVCKKPVSECCPPRQPFLSAFWVYASKWREGDPKVDTVWVVPLETKVKRVPSSKHKHTHTQTHTHTHTQNTHTHTHTKQKQTNTKPHLARFLQSPRFLGLPILGATPLLGAQGPTSATGEVVNEPHGLDFQGHCGACGRAKPNSPQAETLQGWRTDVVLPAKHICTQRLPTNGNSSISGTPFRGSSHLWGLKLQLEHAICFAASQGQPQQTAWHEAMRL